MDDANLRRESEKIFEQRTQAELIGYHVQIKQQTKQGKSQNSIQQ